MWLVKRLVLPIRKITAMSMRAATITVIPTRKRDH
jgi:hypothetical protein